MKTSFLALVAVLANASYAACPFELIKRSRILTNNDLAKVDAVKRDPEAAEALFQAHKRDAAPEPALDDIIGPILGGALDLPLGGRLPKSPLLSDWTQLMDYLIVNGVLQPLAGQLQAINIPKPQIIMLE